MDYKELSEHSDEKKWVTMIVCRDEWTKAISAHVARAEGSVDTVKGIV